MKTAGLTTKQLQRIEKKKKKALAYLAIAELNDQDRYEKQMKLLEKNEPISDDSDDAVYSNLNMMSGDGPSRKKLKKEGLDVTEDKYLELSVAEQPNNFTNNDNNEDGALPFTMNSCYNYPCIEDPYFSYYSSPLEDHLYQEPFLGPFEVLPSSQEESQVYNNYYQYQSYEVRRHHNSETFYYKTDEELYSTNPESTIDGKLLGPWDGYNYYNKNQDKAKTNGKPELTGESYEQLKRQLRERKKFFKCIPRIILKESGERASLETCISDRIPLFLSDIQDLVVFSQTEHTYYKPRWCTFEKANRLSKCVILVVDGFSCLDLNVNETSLSLLKNESFTKVEILMPAAYDGNLIEELSTVPLCPSQQRKLFEEYKTVDNVLRSNLHIRYKILRALFPVTVPAQRSEELPKSDKFSRTDLLLSAWQMLEENYPVPMKEPLKEKYKNYVQTKSKYTEVTPCSPMFALDCEMCRTATGQLELTRISVVNENLEIVYDTLVKPFNKITDYLTRFSGITKQMLDPINVRLADVQKKIREILPPDAILIGQSLNCDLHAMQMMHPYIIDTSVIFNITGIRSRKTKLMTLSREFLSERIQESSCGHCSTEDSLACMKLVKLKLAHSIEFGDAVLVGRPNTELQLQELQSQKDENKNGVTNGAKVRHEDDGQITTSLLFQIANSDKKGVVVGTQKVVNGYSNFQANKSHKKTKANVRALVAETDKDILARACVSGAENDFILTHVQLKEDEQTEEKKEKTIKKLNKWTKKMLHITPMNGMCLILIGNGSRGACFIHINRPAMVPVQ
ncbi:hypothetical protein RUM43_001859 [Polyplax serrata]|uniref:Exonuclease domain-containing protein n=1 Tax=Polyplax serrata TaxID=468196 RepID=A0AAN8XUN8_POLSC